MTHFSLRIFFKVDVLPSTDNEDKVFNPGILIHKNLFEVTIQETPDKNVKKISISNASLILEDFNPPLYELPFHKEVPGSETLLLFSSKNEEKVFKPGILTSKGVYTSLLLELSHRGRKAFKIMSLLMEDMCHLVKEDARLLAKEQSKLDETSGILRNFITEIENLKDLKVKIIRCDNEGEFRNKEMNDFCSRKRIKREFSNARTPQQNEVAERRNRTLIEAARSMLADAKLPVTFWAEAVNTACTNSTSFLGTKEAAGQDVKKDVKKDVSFLRYIALPNWFHEAHLESSTNNAQDACNADAPKSSGNSNPTATSTNPSIIMAISTTEAEYVAAASGYGQVLWIQNQLLDYGHHFIRDCFEKKLISMDHIHTDDNVTDLLTKPFDVGRFQYLVVEQAMRGYVKGNHIIYTTFIDPTAFCDYHNMIAIMEKYEHNIDFHQIVDFVEASHLRQYTRRARIAQSSALPTAADEPASPIRDDSQVIQHQRQQDEMALKITAQDMEIATLKARIKHLEDIDGGGHDPSEEDATIKGRRLETGEEAGCRPMGIERCACWDLDNSTWGASVLSSRVQVSVPPTAEVATVSIPSAGEIPTISVPTGSGMIPTASLIFSTATVATPYSRRKEEMARDAQRMNEQIDRDAEIARIHAEEELQMMIDGLERSNEMIAKHSYEYDQAVGELTIREKIELINELVKYQDHLASILKYKAQQSKPLSKKQQREFYMSVLRSHVEKGERFKRKGLSLEQDNAKKVKISEEVSEEDLKAIMQLVPVEEVYVEALQVKHPIIDWEIQTEGQRIYLKFIWLGGSTASYQFFVDMLKHFDREDLNQLWALVKETLNIRQATSDKKKELWVELKRLYEPDVKDQLWTQTQALLHDPVEWRLYDSCGVHHVLSRDQEIFMLVEKEYPLRKGLAIAMIINKL
uniref:Putative ribonuclease H-like domain-containing protein n=1 Tax=Tanacetum cinerariifolium TaxID=118510 RepID=A0A6L2KG78_TANCI|nr:putative ribonuclease H-like domain-containing protein [Tanacetum cinerariifolium]